MVFGISQKIKNRSLRIQHNFSNINTSTYKYLGVKLDQTLSLCDHIESTYKKASVRLYLMKRIRPNLTAAAALTVYKTMLLFAYCSIITGSYTETMERKIRSFERRAYNIVFPTQNTNSLKIPRIRDFQKERLCLQVYYEWKCL